MAVRVPKMSGASTWSDTAIVEQILAGKTGDNTRWSLQPLHWIPLAANDADGDPQSKRRLVRGETLSPVTCTVRGW